jgi:hypothetical protein
VPPASRLDPTNSLTLLELALVEVGDEIGWLLVDSLQQLGSKNMRPTKDPSPHRPVAFSQRSKGSDSAPAIDHNAAAEFARVGPLGQQQGGEVLPTLMPPYQPP